MKEIKDLDKNYIQKIYIKIGQNVKRIRKEKKISQLSLAHAIGHKSVTVISCCEICHKNYHFNIEHLAKIAYVLEIDITEFFKDI